MERVLAALLAAGLIGFGAYCIHVILALMGNVIPIWFFGAYAAAGFILSVAYDLATTEAVKPPSKRGEDAE